MRPRSLFRRRRTHGADSISNRPNGTAVALFSTAFIAAAPALIRGMNDCIVAIESAPRKMFELLVSRLPRLLIDPSRTLRGARLTCG